MRKKLLNRASVLPTLLWLMLLALLPAKLSAFNYDFGYEYRGQRLYYTIVSEEDKTASVVEPGYGVSGEVEIPDVCYWGNTAYTVVAIEDNAFKGNKDVTRIDIGRNVTTIGEYAFYGCTGLTYISLVYRVTTIGEYAFSECSELETVYIGSSMTTIGARAFMEDGKLTNVYFGSSVETIGDGAFSGTSLSRVVLPPHLKTIGSSAFSRSPLTSVAMGYEVEEIGDDAFNSTRKDLSVYITALNPPTLLGEMFNNISYTLYVMPSENDEVFQAYRSAWPRAEDYYLQNPATEVSFSDNGSTRIVEPGYSGFIWNSLEPKNVTVRNVFCRSSDPDMATVEPYITLSLSEDYPYGSMLHVSNDFASECEIYAETLYPGVYATLTLKSKTTGIEDIAMDEAKAEEARPNDIYNLQGVCLKRNASQDDVDALSPGLYIVGGKKVFVK